MSAEKDDALYTVPVRGFRRWSLEFGTDADGQRWGWLAGVFHHDPWGAGVNEMRCNENPEPHPMLDCTCGFYAVYNPHSVSYDSHAVCGMIEGWGEVIHGPLGFRSQYAKMVALTLPPLPQEGAVRVNIQGHILLLDTDTFPPGVEIEDRPPDNLPDAYNEGIRKAYPLPVFDTIDQMVAQFPVYRGEDPVVPDPSADLWDPPQGLSKSLSWRGLLVSGDELHPHP